MNIINNYGFLSSLRFCFGGRAPSIPQSQPAPTPLPSPSPVISPSEVSPQSAGQARLKRIQDLRYGLQSTIKTSPRGITGQGADLKAPSLTGKTLLG